MIDRKTILEALKIFNGNNVILYNGISNETVTFQDVVDYIVQLQNENDRLNGMIFTQERCNLCGEKDSMAKKIIEEIDNVKDIFPNDIVGYEQAQGWCMCIDKLKEIARDKVVEFDD